MKCGAIDIGTNSCRLLIADRTDKGLTAKVKRIKTTRVGAGVAQQHRISREAVEKTADCLRSFYYVLQTHQAEYFRVVATSAVREADNRQEFLAYINEKTGFAVEVISGKEEACLSYTGVINELPLSGLDLPAVVDLGGGSTEFIWRDDDFEHVYSLPLGAVRASEEHYREQKIRQVLEDSRLSSKIQGNHPLVMVGGTATTLVAIKLKLKEYDPCLVHGQKITKTETRLIYRQLADMLPEERRQLPGLQPERADIIPAGTLIVLMIMEYWGREEIIVSESDILEGIIWGLDLRKAVE